MEHLRHSSPPSSARSRARRPEGGRSPRGRRRSVVVLAARRRAGRDRRERCERLIAWANETGDSPCGQLRRAAPARRDDPVGRRRSDRRPRRMDGVLRVDRRDRMVVLEPGVSWQQLELALAPHGMRVTPPLLPHEGKSVVASLLEREPTLIPRYNSRCRSLCATVASCGAMASACSPARQAPARRHSTTSGDRRRPGGGPGARADRLLPAAHRRPGDDGDRHVGQREVRAAAPVAHELALRRRGAAATSSCRWSPGSACCASATRSWCSTARISAACWRRGRRRAAAGAGRPRCPTGRSCVGSAVAAPAGPSGCACGGMTRPGSPPSTAWRLSDALPGVPAAATFGQRLLGGLAPEPPWQAAPRRRPHRGVLSLDARQVPPATWRHAGRRLETSARGRRSRRLRAAAAPGRLVPRRSFLGTTAATRDETEACSPPGSGGRRRPPSPHRRRRLLLAPLRSLGGPRLRSGRRTRETRCAGQARSSIRRRHEPRQALLRRPAGRES